MTTEPTQESPSESPWDDPTLFSPVGNQELRGQRSGPIRGALRNSAMPITAGHQNRAGHRLYARVNQGRQFRKNILGLGRWRRGRRLVAGEESWAAQTAGGGSGTDRRYLRSAVIASEKAYRRARRQPIRLR